MALLIDENDKSYRLRTKRWQILDIS
uniref:Uncharacterized protein n=1 Tax=Arundo donax TaxID=35708 RepID=A0A0A9BE66_ARUDO